MRLAAKAETLIFVVNLISSSKYFYIVRVFSLQLLCTAYLVLKPARNPFDTHGKPIAPLCTRGWRSGARKGLSAIGSESSRPCAWARRTPRSIEYSE